MTEFVGHSDYSVAKSLTEETFWPEMLSNINSTWQRDRNLIRQFCKERNIRWLCHFSDAANLRSLSPRKMFWGLKLPWTKLCLAKSSSIISSFFVINFTISGSYVSICCNLALLLKISTIFPLFFISSILFLLSLLIM